MSPDQGKSGLPGAILTYSLTITNTGNVADTFNLLASGYSWPTSLTTSSVSLAADGAATITVTVNIPAGVLGDDVDSATISAASQGEGSISDSALLTTGVSPIYAVELSGDDSLTGRPGTTVSYTLWVTNSGNVADKFDLETSGNVWATALSVSSVSLAVGERVAIKIAVSIPETAANFENDQVTMTAVSGHDGTKSDTAVLTTYSIKSQNKIFLPLLFAR